MIENNWYLILELDYDASEIVIEQKIEEKRKYWSQEANHFKNGPKYRKYSDQLPTIEKEMLGATNIREELIKDARKKNAELIDKKLKGIGKSEISESIVDKISEKCGVKSSIVRERAKVLGIKIGANADGDNHQKLYVAYYQKQPQKAVEFKGQKEALNAFNVDNLYEFLSLGTTTKQMAHLPYDSLCKIAEEKQKKEFHKNDGTSGTGSKLCIFCKKTFQDENSKRAYDEYLEYTKRKAILDGLTEAYEIAGEISTEKYDRCLQDLASILKDGKLAKDVLVAFCKIKKIEYASKNIVDTKNSNIRICRCGCWNDISNGRDVCQQCGTKLQIKCPKCGETNDSNINVCKCGFNFENVDKAIALCELAKDAIQKMQLPVAKNYLSDAERYWANSEETVELKKRLTELEGRMGSTEEDMKIACQSKNYYTARKKLGTIKSAFPNYSDSDLELEITSAIENAEKYKKIAQNSTSEIDVVDACVKAYEFCSDCPGIKEILANHPPVKPTNLTITLDSVKKVNVILWKASTTKGLVYYSVVRKEGAIPLNVQDGELVARTSMTSVTDKDIVSCTQYFYAVFAERAGIYSDALVNDKPICNHFEITGVMITSGDGSLQFIWEPIAENATVRLERIEHGQIIKLTCNSRRSFVDTELVNEKEYQYKIFLQYTVGMENFVTPGVNITGIPATPPLPIEKLIVKPIQDNDFQIEWEKRENSNIKFYYSENKPEFLCGDVLPLAVLESAMNPLLVQKKGDTIGTFSYAADKLIYIVAAVVKSGSAVVGTVARANKGEALKINDITPVNGNLLISIDLPKGATGFVVLYRFDQFPDDISDVKTTRKYISLKKYEYDNGLLIDANEQQNYYFSVFAEFKIDGEKDYSTGTDRLYSSVPKEIITYSVDVRKKIFGPNILTLVFKTENKKFLLPEIDIMSAIGGAPMFKQKAKFFYEIPKQEVEGVAEYKITLEKGMPKDTYIKAFLKDEKLQGRYQLKISEKSNLQIS